MPCYRPRPNLDYIKTVPGILKAISLVFGFFAVLFLTVSFKLSTYHNECSEIERAGNPHNLTDCSAIIFGSAPHCDHIVAETEKMKAYLQKNQKSLSPEVRKRMEYVVTQLPTSCPSLSLWFTGIFTLYFSWMPSVAMFIYIVWQGRPRNLDSDLLCHGAATVFLLISSTCLFGFLIWALAGKYPCTQEIYDELRSGKKVPAQYQALFLDKQVWSWEEVMANSTNDKPSMEEFPKKDCQADIESTYKILLLSIGTAFLAITTILHGITSIDIWSLRRKETVKVAPVAPPPPPPEETKAVEQHPVE